MGAQHTPGPWFGNAQQPYTLADLKAADAFLLRLNSNGPEDSRERGILIPAALDAWDAIRAAIAKAESRS